MNLITVAHLGEAEALIDQFGLKRSSDKTFESEGLVLLLTGEGPFEAVARTASMLTARNFGRTFNLGIAGALGDQPVGSFHRVRTHYLIIEGKPQFKTFPSSETGVDCLTTMERILSPEKARPLAGIGGLVDRESWGVAFACKEAGVSFSSYKVVSDSAGTINACELVREHAASFAEIIATNAMRFLGHDIVDDLPGFHFTHSTRLQFRRSLEMLERRDGIASEEILRSLPLQVLRAQKILPKERTRRLLVEIDHRLDPLRHKLSERLEEWKHRWKKQGLTLQPDPTFEKKSVDIHLEVQNIEDLAQKAQTLRELDLETFYKLRDGDVE